MARFKIVLEYQGTRYRGWQIQRNARTVQGELHKALSKVVPGCQFELRGAGRTDAGVHALRQVAHLEIETRLPVRNLVERWNGELPSDINILGLHKVAARFHARHDAVSRSYLYQISRRRTAFGKNLVWWVPDRLDLGLMRAAAELFPGMRDFVSFSADKPDPGEAAARNPKQLGGKSTLVLLEAVEIAEDGDLILIRIRGSHFLWKMVRRIVGVLVEVGRERLSVDEVKGFLSAPSSRPAELTAPPSGLFLENVWHPGDEEQDIPLSPVMRIANRAC